MRTVLIVVASVAAAAAIFTAGVKVGASRTRREDDEGHPTFDRHLSMLQTAMECDDRELANELLKEMALLWDRSEVQAIDRDRWRLFEGVFNHRTNQLVTSLGMLRDELDASGMLGDEIEVELKAFKEAVCEMDTFLEKKGERYRDAAVLDGLGGEVSDG